jgi:hypothetical protein
LDRTQEVGGSDPLEPSVLLDSHGRAVMVGGYGLGNKRGSAVARHVIDR